MTTRRSSKNVLEYPMIPFFPDPAPVKICPHCGAELSGDGDAFCSVCQVQLDDRDGTAKASPLDIVEDGPRPMWEWAASLFGYGECLLYNRVAYLILLFSFGPAILCGALIGDLSPRKPLVIGGLLSTAIDLTYRLSSPTRHWLRLSRGGRFFCFPIWLMGIFWLVMGLRG